MAIKRSKFSKYRERRWRFWKYGYIRSYKVQTVFYKILLYRKKHNKRLVTYLVYIVKNVYKIENKKERELNIVKIIKKQISKNK